MSAFLEIFQNLHLGHHGSEDLRFRLRLLKFAVLFTRRSTQMETTPSDLQLRKLRDEREEQVQVFTSKKSGAMRLNPQDLTEESVTPDNLRIKQERFTHDVTPFDRIDSDCHSMPPSVSLIDTLPMFMALSAAQNATVNDAKITKVWMLLAAGYMAQAAMEQYINYDNHQVDVLREAFAWGFDPECVAEPESDEWRINAMFWGDDEVIPEWDAVRDDHIQAVCIMNSAYSMIESLFLPAYTT